MNRQRICYLALVLILALAPSGLAESAYGSLTLNNFHLELGADKPVDVKASVKVGYGGQLPDGPARLDVLITGGEKTAFSGMASLQDGTLQAVLDKSKYRFQIPLEGLEDDLFAQTPYSLMYNLWYVLPSEVYYGLSDAMYSGWGSDREGPKEEDFQKAWDLMGRYAAYYSKYFDPEQSKERDRKLSGILKPESKGRETVDLFGKKVSLYRYEMSFEGSGLKTYFEASYQADPELKALEEEAAELAEAFGFSRKDEGKEASDAETEDSDKDADKDDAKAEDAAKDDAKAEDAAKDEAKAEDSADGEVQDPLDEMIENAGFEKVSYVIWSDTEVIGDADSKAQKALMTMTMKDAVDEYGMPVVLEIPVSTCWQLLDTGRRIGFEVTYAPYKGESVKAVFDGTLDASGKDGGTVTDIKTTLDMSSEESGIELTATLSASEAVDKTGVGDTTVSVKGTANGQDFKLGYAYDGRASTEREKSGTVTLSYEIPTTSVTGGGAPSKAVIRFNSLVETGPYQAADFTPYKDLQPVNPMRASSKAMDKVSGDLYGAMMQGVGVLMQTRGLSSVIGGLMSDLIPQ